MSSAEAKQTDATICIDQTPSNEIKIVVVVVIFGSQFNSKNIFKLLRNDIFFFGIFQLTT